MHVRPWRALSNASCTILNNGYTAYRPVDGPVDGPISWNPDTYSFTFSIKGRGCFIKQQYFWFPNQCSCDCNSLFLTTLILNRQSYRTGNDQNNRFNGYNQCFTWQLAAFLATISLKPTGKIFDKVISIGFLCGIFYCFHYWRGCRFCRLNNQSLVTVRLLATTLVFIVKPEV